MSSMLESAHVMVKRAAQQLKLEEAVIKRILKSDQVHSFEV